jgi:hypothetical protein
MPKVLGWKENANASCAKNRDPRAFPSLPAFLSFISSGSFSDPLISIELRGGLDAQLK